MRIALIAALVSLPLAACGSSQIDRTLSGASIGGATGAVGAAVVGGSVGPALVVGAVAGGIVGAATKKSDIDLGKPFWR